MKKHFLMALAILSLIPAVVHGGDKYGPANSTPYYTVFRDIGVTDPVTGAEIFVPEVYVQGSGGGGGGAVTAAAGSYADGALVTLGALADGACSTDAGSCSQMALLKRENQRLTSILTALGSPFQAGGSVGLTGTLPAFAATPTFNCGTGCFQATQPISATSLPLPAGAATSAGLTTINTTLGSPFQAGGSIGNTAFALNAGTANIGVVGVAQASTTSGQFGSLGQCAVTTGAPTYTTAQTDPLSCDTAGNLRVNPGTVTIASNSAVNIAQFAGTNAVTGTGASGAGVPRVTVANDSNILATQSGTWADTVTGNVAGGATDSGNPVKIGCPFNTTPPTVTNGQRVDCQSGSRGQIYFNLYDGVSTLTMRNSGVDGIGNSSMGAAGAYGFNNLFNGTSWDRSRTITGAASDGTGLGVTAVEHAGASFTHITTATTVTSKSGKGILHTLCINTDAASATITAYDNTAGSGTVILAITNPAALLTQGPQCATYDLEFSTGLTFVTTGTQDITAVWR